AGTYMVSGNQVVHHVDASWNESWTGTDQVRNFKFDGERLTIATAPSPSPRTGKMSVRTLVWEKVRWSRGYDCARGPWIETRGFGALLTMRSNKWLTLSPPTS